MMVVLARVGVAGVRLLGVWMLLGGLDCVLALIGGDCFLGVDGLCLVAGLFMIPAGIRLMALKRWAAVAVCLMWWLMAVRYHFTLAEAVIPGVLTLGTAAGWRSLRSGV